MFRKTNEKHEEVNEQVNATVISEDVLKGPFTINANEGDKLVETNIQEKYYQDALVDTTTAISHMLIRKHINYGPNNLKRFGLDGIIIRMTDKIERLINLAYHKPVEQINGDAAKSIKRELMDLAGYSIQGILLLEGKLDWPLKQKEEQEQNK